MAADENLSEVLFKPTRKSLETSFVSNTVSRDSFFEDFATRKMNGDEDIPHEWFRKISLLYAGWLGLDVIEMQSTLASIAASTNKRTRENVLDTVYEYGSGNWIYEFSLIASRYAQEATQAEENDDHEEAYRLHRLAYLFYAVASYPHLKGDELSTQALLQHYIHYRAASKKVEGDFIELKVAHENKEITAFLHTPNKNTLCPAVMICGNYETLCTEYLRFYREYLYPNGIALIAVDLPGIGLNVNLPVETNLGYAHQLVLDYIVKNVPCIDRERIGILSQRLGSNAACHVLLNNMSNVKCLCMVGPLLHDYFVNKELLTRTPIMIRSILANRLDFDVSRWDNIIPQIQVYSIKKQGLFSGGIKVDKPLLVIGSEIDYLSPKDDLKYAQSLSSNGDLIVIKKKQKGIEVFNEVIALAVDFFKRELL